MHLPPDEVCVNIRTVPGKLYASVHTRTQARANGPNRPKTAAPAVGHHGSWAGVAVPRKEVTVTPAGGTYGVVSLMYACFYVRVSVHVCTLCVPSILSLP